MVDGLQHLYYSTSRTIIYHESHSRIQQTSHRMLSSQLKEGEEKRKQQGRGSHAYKSSTHSWLLLTDGFLSPLRMTTTRMAYCSDTSTLGHYDPLNKRLLLTDIQFGKRKVRAPQKVKMSVDGKDENVWYWIVPCWGVKYCGKYEERWTSSLIPRPRLQDKSGSGLRTRLCHINKGELSLSTTSWCKADPINWMHCRICLSLAKRWGWHTKRITGFRHSGSNLHNLRCT